MATQTIHKTVYGLSVYAQAPGMRDRSQDTDVTYRMPQETPHAAIAPNGSHTYDRRQAAMIPQKANGIIHKTKRFVITPATVTISKYIAHNGNVMIVALKLTDMEFPNHRIIFDLKERLPLKFSFL